MRYPREAARRSRSSSTCGRSRSGTSSSQPAERRSPTSGSTRRTCSPSARSRRNARRRPRASAPHASPARTGNGETKDEGGDSAESPPDQVARRAPARVAQLPARALAHPGDVRLRVARGRCGVDDERAAAARGRHSRRGDVDVRPDACGLEAVDRARRGRRHPRRRRPDLRPERGDRSGGHRLGRARRRDDRDDRARRRRPGRRQRAVGHRRGLYLPAVRAPLHVPLRRARPARLGRLLRPGHRRHALRCASTSAT